MYADLNGPLPELTPVDPVAAASEQIRKRKPWRPFPETFFPHIIGEYIDKVSTETARSDPAFMAIPMLGVVSGIIGSRWWFRLQSGGIRPYKQPAYLWAAIVAGTGDNKSAGFDSANQLAIDQDQIMQDISRGEADSHDRAVEAWQAADKPTRGPKPQAPPRRRVRVGDATYESIATICKDNRHGLLSSHDELKNFFLGLGRYKKAGQSSDSSRYLEAWNGSGIFYDRKDGSSCTIPRCGLSVTGTIQPEILRATMTDSDSESGFLSRWIFARPPATKRHVDLDLPEGDQGVYSSVMDAMSGIISSRHDMNAHRWCKPVRSAGKLWVDWQHDWFDKTEAEADRRLKAMMTKVESMSLRFALIHHIMLYCWPDILRNQPHEIDISEESIRQGIELAEWVDYENRRVYAEVLDPVVESNDRQIERLYDWMCRVCFGGSPKFAGVVTARDVCRASICKHAEEAQAMLEGLVEHGLAEPRKRDAKRTGPGRPTDASFAPLLRREAEEDGDEN